MNDYIKQADDFLSSHNIKLGIIWLKCDKHFDDDKEPRDIYRCAFSRENSRGFEVIFGASLADSKKRHMTQQEWIRGGWKLADKINQNPDNIFSYDRQMKKWKLIEPSAYDILSCLTKSEPGKFSDFCVGYCYNEDSRKAYKIYKAVRDEWLDVQSFFSAEEIEELQEIN